MLTAVLFSIPGYSQPFAPTGLLHIESIGSMLRQVAADSYSMNKPNSWLADSRCARFWPEAEVCSQLGPNLLQWIDSSRDTWLLAAADSLNFLLPQINRILIFQVNPPVQPEMDQHLYEFGNLAALGFKQSDLTGFPSGIVFWQRPTCAELIAGLTVGGNCDLHLHTNRSDGADSPEELVDRVLAAGLDAFAITDHDNLAALEPARQHLAAQNQKAGCTVKFIPGVELSVDAGRELHLLAYFPRGGQEIIAKFLEQQQITRHERNIKMISQLQQLGYSISLADFATNGDGTVGRLQAALILRDRGHFTSIDEVFDQLLNPGKPGYIDRSRPSAAETIWLVRQAGGVAVLAHPADYGWCNGGPIASPLLLTKFEALKAVGLQGVEAFHGEASPADQLEISAAARALGLIRSAGSDDHGANKEHAHLYQNGSRWLMPGEILVVAALIAGPLNNGRPTWLLTRRSTPGPGYGQWELPGGKVEPGESPGEALARELQEELGISASIGERRHVLSYDYPGRRVILVSFMAEATEKTWQLSVHDEARFVTAEEALSLPLLPADVHLFQDLLG